MGKNINQITTAASSILATDKMYLGRSPFGLTDDRYILGSSIISQFASNLGIKTIGTTGSDYTSIGNALATPGYYNFLIKTAISESADVDIGADGDYHFVFSPNCSDNFGTYKFNILNGVTANIHVWNGTFLYGYGSAQSFITYTGSGAGSIYFDGVRIVNSSSVNFCYVNGIPSAAGYTQNFVGCRVELPDHQFCGIRMAAGIMLDHTMVSGGPACSNSLIATGGQFSSLRFEGDEWYGTSCATFSNSTVNGMVITSTISTTPLIRVQVNSNSSLQGLFAADGRAIAVGIDKDSVLSNSNLGAGDLYLTSADGCSTISNVIATGPTVGSAGGAGNFSNVQFTGASFTHTVPNCSFSNCNFASNVLIQADNTMMTGTNVGVPSGTSGNTITFDTGVEGCIVIGSHTEVAVVDNSGNPGDNVFYANLTW